MKNIKNLITVIAVLLFSSNAFSQANPGMELIINPIAIGLNDTAVLTVSVTNFGNGNSIVGNSLKAQVQVGTNAEILGFAPGSSANWTVLTSTTGASNIYNLKNIGTLADFGVDDIKLLVKGVALGGPSNISGNITYLPGINPLLSPPAPNASQGNASTADDNALTSLIVTAPFIVSNSFAPIICNGGTTVVTISATGGTPPYTGTGIFTVAAGSYTYTVTDNLGSVKSTSLTISNPAALTGSSTVTACNSATLIGYASNPVTASGTYTANITTASGCDSVHTYNVTINQGTFTSTTHTACDSYTWPTNATTYTVSGSYVNTYTNTSGCASADTLHLTINASTTNSVTIAACNSYTWPAPLGNGTTYNTSGTYTNTSTNAAGCTHVETLVLTINTPTSTSTTQTAIGTYTWPVNATTYTVSGTYTSAGVNTITGCTHTDTLILTITPPIVLVSAKAFLGGAYVSAIGMMRDELRTKNLIPTTQPYGLTPYISGFTHVGGGSETTSSAVLTVSGNDAIVDWVFVSLRSATNPATVVATQSALIQRDGDIVSASDGVSPLTFNAMPGYYFVAVDHRNHLGILTADSFALGAITTPINLTNGSAALHVNATNNNPSPLTGATKNVGGVRVMYPGNCNINNVVLAKQVSYGPASTTDRSALFTATGGTATINAYTIFDVDLNGFARYNGLNPDRTIISTTVNNSNTIIAHEQQP